MGVKSLMRVGRIGRLHVPYTVAGIALLLVTWSMASWHLQNPILLPSPTIVVVRLVKGVASGELLRHTLFSTYRVLLGFLIALATAIPLGFCLALSRIFHWLCEPFIELLRPIPPFAWISIALLGFGTGLTGKLFIIWVAAFFPILLNTFQAVREVPVNLVQAARTLGASKPFLLFHVIVPASVPFTITGMRLGLAAGWMSVLAAEMVASSEGLGFMMLDARELLQVDLVLAGVGIIGLIGYTFNTMLVALERWSLRYKRTIAKGEEHGTNRFDGHSQGLA